MKFIAVIALLTGCTTPDHWSAESHRDMLMQCRVACGDTGIASYDAWLAKCACHKPVAKLDDL